MLICVECGEKFEDMDTSINYFICEDCLMDID